MRGGAVGGVITVWWSTGSCSGPGPAARGVTCPGSTGTGRRSIAGIAAGRWAGPGRRSWAGCDEAEGPDWTISADSTVVRARQHAAGARHALPAELVTVSELPRNASGKVIKKQLAGLATEIPPERASR